jgi:AraC-like DNA-binding protein
MIFLNSYQSNYTDQAQMIYTSAFINLLVCLILFLYHWPQKKEIFILILAIIGANIRQYIYLLVDMPEEINTYTILFLHADPLSCISGPLVLLYLKITLDKSYTWKPIYWLFLIPSILFFINLIPYYSMGFDEKVKLIREFLSLDGNKKVLFPYLLFKISFQRILGPLLNNLILIYGIYYLIKIKKSIISKKTIFLINGFIMMMAIYAVPVILVYMNILYKNMYLANDFETNAVFRKFSYLKNFLIINIQLAPICYFLFPSFLYGGSSVNSLRDIFLTIQQRLGGNSDSEDEMKLKESDDVTSIINFIHEKKPYLNAEFTIHDLTSKLNIPHHRVSQCFNNEIQVSFPVFRNQLRVEYAIGLLKNDDHKSMSIEGIAMQSGFKTKSSFYSAFRSVYHMTPTEWIAKNL